MTCEHCGAELAAEAVECREGQHFDQQGERVGKIVYGTANIEIEITT